MTDPSTVPLPPSRDSLDYPRPASLANGVAGLSLDPLPEQEQEQSNGGEGADDAVEQEEMYEGAEERIRRLEEELSLTTQEKDQFEAQYRSLLGKLTNMRNTLGDKLKQDAVSWLHDSALSRSGGPPRG